MAYKKITAALLGLMFLGFVAVQYNDPDPVVWMAVYGIGALLCFLFAAGKAPVPLLWTAAVLFAVGGVYMWPERFEGVSIGGGDIRNIEEARESLGLFLASLIFAGFALFDKYSQHPVARQAQHQKKKWANRS